MNASQPPPGDGAPGEQPPPPPEADRAPAAEGPDEQAGQDAPPYPPADSAHPDRAVGMPRTHPPGGTPPEGRGESPQPYPPGGTPPEGPAGGPQPYPPAEGQAGAPQMYPPAGAGAGTPQPQPPGGAFPAGQGGVPQPYPVGAHPPQPYPPGGAPAGMPRPAGGAQPPAPGGYPADRAFSAPDGTTWMGVSPRFTWHRRVSAVLWAVPAALSGGLLVLQVSGGAGALLWVAAVLVSCGLGWIVAELAYRSWGYVERADDLLVSYGVFVKRLVVVPYGRMQFVDVTAGPVEQWLGIATVRLHTAAAATDARIPGLPKAEAAQLRDRLARRGEERSMGL